MLTAEQLLAGAADLVEENWGQGPNIGDWVNGPWCAGSAINAMAYNTGLREQERIRHTAYHALAVELGIPDSCVPKWNDELGRTKEEVSSALRNAKRHLSPEGDLT